jgi:hypothetical protein
LIWIYLSGFLVKPIPLQKRRCPKNFLSHSTMKREMAVSVWMSGGENIGSRVRCGTTCALIRPR